ncbi:MAG TPA: glutamate synthase [Gammaproteobacteria bacterium]|nr:glutamate synthase [Gammaproteobacteria bacterium]HBF61983.1 glutamate synthase [Gammaproteobacteria bacterium]|tara:strand:+ start:27 stop:269 length:243 start_codon:yes stop_codon:yes gene_type:complete
MSTPDIPQKNPLPVDVEEGRKYFWCSCGKSDRQPFCDGSHQGTEFLPLTYVAETTRTLYFCACKHTRGAPLCDGSHNSLD